MRVCWTVLCACAAMAADSGNGNENGDTKNTTEGYTLPEIERTTLTTIRYGAKIGINISITLSKQEYDEDYYLYTPHKEVFKLGETDIDGAQVYANSTHFVSCRVVIGPLEESLLGTWTLCGVRTIGHITYERCQPGLISWAIDNPENNWSSTTQARFNHVVNYGFSLSPTVRGTGTVNTCHVVTPAGEDIALTFTSDYPGLVRFNDRNANVCNVTIGPIDVNFIGDWVLYGTFHGNAGFNEIILPMNFFIYDEEDPYNQAYNVSYMAMRTHPISPYGVIVQNVTGSGVRTECELITNTGVRYNEITIAGFEAASFVNTNNAACRVEIGPWTHDMYGDWMLIGKFFRNNVYNETQLPLRFIEEDPSNPLPDDIDRPILYLSSQNIMTRYGQSHEISTAMGSRMATDSCHIRTPDNLQYVLREGWATPNVEGVVSSRISCGIRVYVNNASAVGEWMLIDRISIRQVPQERRLLFTIRVEEEPEPEEEEEVDEDEILESTNSTVTLATIQYRARTGINVTMSLSRKDYTENCYVRTPEGKELKFEDGNTNGIFVYPTRTNFVSCRVVIGPIDDTLLGTWTLCGVHTVGQATHERCQPGIVSWANDNNPSDKWASTTYANFDHVVHYGFTLSPLVRGTGTLQTCHVITPDGEDISVSRTSDYPGLSLRDNSICNISIGAINEHFIGNWAIYGIFSSAIIGFNIVTQPMTFFLYDEENPYNQAYNVTTMNTESHIILEGVTQLITVTSSGTRRSCEFISNTGVRYDESESGSMPGVTFVNSNNAACLLQIGPLTKELFGDWVLIGKFVRNTVLFVELRQPFRLIEEDPANPIPDDVERRIEYLNAQSTYSNFGNSHTFTTAVANRMTTDSCHIRTPQNLQYILRSGLNLPGFQTVTGSRIACGVQVRVLDEDSLGQWMLIARVTDSGTRIEQRLPFTIHVEEEVNAEPRTVTVAEGNNLYMRLEEPTSLFDTCILISPSRNDADRDENFIDRCGFIVRDVSIADAGTWEIEYGTGKMYRALIRVTVTPRYQLPENSLLTWTQDAPVNVTIGPENAEFCSVEDPLGVKVSHGFGRCKIVLDRARSDHEGVWKITVGTSGRVRTDIYEFIVKLSTADPKASVATSVVTEKPSVTLTCQVETKNEVTVCKFEDPSGKVLLVNQGVGEDRYSFHAGGNRLNSDANIHECGLRITNPLVEDLGLWRCVIETEDNTYYGFLTVLCPWAMLEPTVAAAVVTEPTLTSERESLKAIEGNNVIMRCSVQSAIRYCYFRAQNGTVYTVSPSTSDWFEYAGHGLDSGECSIRFPALQASDSGRWSCHVGFNDSTEPEQSAQIQLHVDPLMVADQYHLTDDDQGTLVVHSKVHSQHSLEYCRFVRMDGIGFTSDKVPSGYEDHSLLANGKCEIRIPNASILERHPWTVVAKIVGYNSELTRSTQHTMTVLEPDTESPATPTIDSEPPVTEPLPPSTEPESSWTQPETPVPLEVNEKNSALMVIWSCVIAVCVALFTIGLLLGPTRNREWTLRRAATFRASLRNSLIKKKKPTPTTQIVQATPA